MCIVLHEMTFLSFDQQEIQKKWEELDRRIKEFESMSEEERRANTYTMEEVKQRIEEKLKNLRGDGDPK